MLLVCGGIWSDLRSVSISRGRTDILRAIFFSGPTHTQKHIYFFLFLFFPSIRNNSLANTLFKKGLRTGSLLGVTWRLMRDCRGHRLEGFLYFDFLHRFWF